MDKYNLRKELEKVLAEAQEIIKESNSSDSVINDIYQRLIKAKRDYLDNHIENEQNISLVTKADDAAISLQDMMASKSFDSKEEWTKNEWIEKIKEAFDNGDKDLAKKLINDFKQTGYKSNQIETIENKLNNIDFKEVPFEAALILSSAKSAIDVKNFESAEKIVNEAVALNDGILWDDAKALISEIEEGKANEETFMEAKREESKGNFSKAITILEKLNARVQHTDNEYKDKLTDLKELNKSFRDMSERVDNLSRHSSFSELGDVFSIIHLYDIYDNLAEYINNKEKKILDILKVKLSALNIDIENSIKIQNKRNISLKADFNKFEETQEDIDSYLKEKEIFKVVDLGGRFDLDSENYKKFEELYEELNDMNQSLETQYQNADSNSTAKKQRAYRRTSKVRGKYPNDERSIFIEDEYENSNKRIWGRRILFVVLFFVLVFIVYQQIGKQIDKNNIQKTQTQASINLTLTVTPTATFTPTPIPTSTPTLTPSPTSLPIRALVDNLNNRVPVKYGCYTNYTTSFYVSGGSWVTLIPQNDNSLIVLDDHPNFAQECIFIEGVDSNDGVTKPGFILVNYLDFSEISE